MKNVLPKYVVVGNVTVLTFCNRDDGINYNRNI